jgi:PAS domain S-box-containing protein
MDLLLLAIEQSSEGIAVSDLKGNLEYLNEAFAKMHGYSPEELVGKNLSIFHSPQQMPSVKAANRKLKKTGVFKGEIWHLKRNSTEFPTLMHNSLVRDNKGKPVAMIATLRDITDIKRTKEALKGSEQLNALMNATTDTALLIDLKGYVVAANAVTAERFQTTQDQFLGTCVYDLMSPSLAKSRKTIANLVVKTGKPCRFEDERAGIVFDSSIYPVFNERGKVVQLAIFGKDITERKRSEQMLKKSEEDLRIKSNRFEEMNTALKILLDNRVEDQREFEERILANVKHLVLPYLGKMRKHLTDEKLKAYLQILETNLSNIISPFSQKLSSKYMYLTTTEIEVANLVKEGQNSKDISKMLGTSYKTIQNHRVNIRKKLGITKKPVNLRTYLSSLQ